ncbi:MAG: YaeQ family protein, partial [Rubrivivax sp.]
MAVFSAGADSSTDCCPSLTQLQMADMDRALYADHALTLALHPS